MARQTAEHHEGHVTGEPLAGIADTHYHPMEPLSVRTGVTLHW